MGGTLKCLGTAHIIVNMKSKGEQGPEEREDFNSIDWEGIG